MGEAESGKAALGSRSTSLAGTSRLVAKWITIGASAGLVGIGVAQAIQELATKAERRPAASVAVDTYANAPAQLPPHATAPTTGNAPEPAQAVESAARPAAQPAPVAPTAPTASGAAIAPAASAPPEAMSASQVSSGEPASAVPNDRRSSLTRELSLLEQARSALSQHAAKRALQTLDTYRAEFPRGSMQVEASALRIEAVGQSGDRALAQSLAQSFLDTFPTGPVAARVRAISDVSIAAPDEQKP